MILSRGFKFRIYPTEEQETLFRQFAGVCRLVYNLGLEQRREFWRQFKNQTGKSISVVSQCKELTDLRAEVDWIAAVPVNVQQQALRDLDRAYSNFFAGRAAYPTPRRRGINDNFRFPAVHCGALTKLNAKWSVIRLPKLGMVRVRTHRALEGRSLSITISQTAGKWFAAFGCEIERTPVERPNLPMIGIDRGVTATLMLSTGRAMRLDKERLNLLDRRYRKAQRAASRKARGSNRSAKAKALVAKVSAKTAAYRKDWSHKASYNIAERNNVVVLEKLNIQNMTATAKGTLAEPGTRVKQKAGLNRAILTQGWHFFETVLDYKLTERGGHLLMVDPRYTSQTCAVCGHVDASNRLSQAEFECTSCGHEANADRNAALNILHRGQSAGVERGSSAASKRKATGRKTPKTSVQAEAQLSRVHSNETEPATQEARPRKRKRDPCLTA